MNSLVNYVIQSAFCLLIFYGFYFIFLKKETCFQYNRAYLFLSSILALSVPLIDLYSLFGIHRWQQSTLIPAIYLPEITLTSEGSKYYTPGFEINLPVFLTVAYFTGFTFFLFRFLIQILAIKKIIVKNRYNIKYWKGCYLINTGGKLPTFSFFKYLFWDDSIGFTEGEKSQILTHELVHIRQKHSYDIIYFEILGVLFWFNPLIKLYKKAVIDTHEFIADNQVIKTTDASHYGHLIVRQLFKRMDLAVGSYFNKSQAYRRLNMIKINGQKTRLYKLLMSLPLVAGLVLVMGFNVDQGPTAEFISRNLPPLLENKGFRPYKNLLYIEKQWKPPLLLDPQLKKLRKNGEFKEESTVSPLAESEKSIHLDELLPPESKLTIKSAAPDKEEIFTIVEHQPVPVGGMKSFYAYVQKNLKYPRKARRMGIEGKVFVQFVVDKEGSLNDIKVLKGIGAGCDKEAKKVVQNAEKWIPGRQNGRLVKVRIVLPITFKLD